MANETLHSRGEVRRIATDRNRRPVRRCQLCCDLPDRRPADGCPRCGRPHVTEAPVTLAYVEAWPRPSGRELV